MERAAEYKLKGCFVFLYLCLINLRSKSDVNGLFCLFVSLNGIFHISMLTILQHTYLKVIDHNTMF